MSTTTGGLFLNPLERELQVVRPADGLALAVVVAGGIAFDVAVRSGVASLGGAVAATAMAALLFATRRFESRTSQALLSAASVFGWWLLGRSSPELAVLNAVAVTGLAVIAAALSRSGSLFDATWPEWCRRAAHAALHALAGAGFASAAARRANVVAPQHRALAGGIARGMVLAAPIFMSAAALLAWGDAIFASIFDVEIDAGSLSWHVVLTVFGALAVAGTVRVASAAPPRRWALTPILIGWVEVAVVLGSLVVLYAAFAVVQVVAATGGADHVLATSGLTYATYARSGFFQLLAVAVMTLFLVVAARSVTADATGTGRRVVTALTLAAVALTLMIVAVAVRRLQLYSDAFGLTLLRFYASAFALWIGAVFVAFGLSAGGVGRPRQWFPGAVGMLALTALFLLNVANPHGHIATTNLERAVAGHRFDASYLGQLSPDAVPAIEARADRLPPEHVAAVREAVCPRAVHVPQGLWSYNAARTSGARAHHALCPNLRQ